MGIPCRVNICEDELGYRCKQCYAPLTCRGDHIPGGSFSGKYGRALFIDKVWNIEREPPENQIMRTGRYTVQTVNCSQCHTYLGWTYVRAFQRMECYKEGKFCLEYSQLDYIHFHDSDSESSDN